MLLHAGDFFKKRKTFISFKKDRMKKDTFLTCDKVMKSFHEYCSSCLQDAELPAGAARSARAFIVH